MKIENLLIFFIALFNFFLIFFFDKIKLFKINIDKPDGKRKLHKNPIPLAGGIIIFLNLVIYFLFILKNPNLLLNEIIFKNDKNLILFFITSISIFTLGFIDDKLNISAFIKFIVIIILIGFILLLDETLKIQIIKFSFIDNEFYLSKYSIIFTCFCFLVYLNAFNMFDGINLQSSIYSIIIFLSILFIYHDLFLIKVLLISIISYSYLNFKNKSFLGDSGSLLLAFIIGYIFIQLYNNRVINFTDEVVVYMLLPGIDLIRLFFKRIFLKRNPLTPDRFHLHHLLISQYSYKKSLIILFCLIILPIVMNYFASSKFFIISSFVSIYVILILLIKIKNLR